MDELKEKARLTEKILNGTIIFCDDFMIVSEEEPLYDDYNTPRIKCTAGITPIYTDGGYTNFDRRCKRPNGHKGLHEAVETHNGKIVARARWI